MVQMAASSRAGSLASRRSNGLVRSRAVGFPAPIRLYLPFRQFNISTSRAAQIASGNGATDMMVTFATRVLQANGQSAAEARLDVAHVVRAIYMVSLPLEANVQFMTVMATTMPLVCRG